LQAFHRRSLRKVGNIFL